MEASVWPFCPVRWPYIGQRGFDCLVMRLPVFAGQVLPDCHQHPLGVSFWPARTIGRCFIVA
ncbi:MAG: hypothetical protein GDA36_04150 [Rhodobacteraceae bacterium]|nr:hypothetical protein [Paracoccaceae bacterium]